MQLTWLDASDGFHVMSCQANLQVLATAMLASALHSLVLQNKQNVKELFIGLYHNTEQYNKKTWERANHTRIDANQVMQTLYIWCGEVALCEVCVMSWWRKCLYQFPAAGSMYVYICGCSTLWFPLVVAVYFIAIYICFIKGEKMQ